MNKVEQNSDRKPLCQDHGDNKNCTLVILALFIYASSLLNSEFITNLTSAHPTDEESRPLLVYSENKTYQIKLRDNSSIDSLPPHLQSLFFRPIPINKADQILLSTIPGIGPSLSKGIAALCEKENGISNFDELLQVKGIGESKLATIKKYCAL